MNRSPGIVAIALLVASVTLIVAALCVTPGCAADQAGRQQQFDDAVRQAEAVKVAAKAEIDKRIADVKAVFDQQAASLKTHIEELTAQVQQHRATIAALEAEAQAKPDTAAEIAKAVAKVKEEEAKAKASAEAAGKLYAKLEGTYNDTAGKLEKVTAEIFRNADERIASLKAERDRITSMDPGQQIQGVGNTIASAVPGQAGLIIGLIATTVGGIVSSIHQARQKTAVTAAAHEAIGTMSQAIEANLIQWTDEGGKVLNDAQSTAAKKLVKEADEAYADAIKISKASAAHRSLQAAMPHN